VAIDRLKTFEDFALEMNPAGYYVAYSGGKDSDCIRILCELAGVKHELWHNHTTVDAPETVRYVRSIPGMNISYPEISMWNLIVKRGVPTRKARFCCEKLKEYGGVGRFVVSGVRRFESNNRANRKSIEIMTGKKTENNIIFTDDNKENRRILEHCQLKGKLTLNPIVDWYDDDVWEFLNYYNCKSNPLYQCGYKRIGCVGCPMAGSKGQLKEFADYPKYKKIYIRAFDKMLKRRIEIGKPFKLWQSGEEVFDWWTSGQAAEFDIDGQIDLWDGSRRETVEL
jgi:phosphoadenosine phosphosulfate reductase